MRFEGKRAVVTGGGSGIGKATAERLAAEGAQVWIGDINAETGGAVAEASGGRIRFHHTDVTKPDEIAALIHACDDEGGIDLLFNNAGSGGGRARIDEMTSEEWDRVQALLLRSCVIGIREAAPVMAAKGGGAIVNTASIAGVQSGAAGIAYSVAKAGVIHLSKLAAAELSKDGIRVNAVCPGLILTGIFTANPELTAEARQAINAGLQARAAGSQPVRKPGLPEDVAALVCFLLSDDAAFITGEHVMVDGGMSVGPRHSWDPAMGGLLGGVLAGAVGAAAR
jgi:NAD(P)-dependent dehydrogenase (short-subunit alcohol dehydrogenase family)